MKYTQGIVKHFVKNKIKRPQHKSFPLLKGNKTTPFSRAVHSTKRYSKQTLKNVLLSKIFHSAFKIFITVFIISATLYGIYAYFHTALKNEVVVSESEIVDRVSKLVTIPNEVPEDVVRVEDAEILKKQNSFYENVKVGDYIIMYQKLAIIYDLRNNVIVAMKKVE